MTKQELMFSVLEEYEQSNLSISAFCNARSLKVPRFHYWRRKFRSLQTVPKGFIPILPAASVERAAIRLAYPNGVSIHLPSADLALIAQLIHLA
jgi:hypothetical protein